MPELIFQIGTNSELSIRELQSVLSDYPQFHIAKKLVKIAVPDALSPDKLITILGGTVKILKPIKTLQSPDEQEILSEATGYLASQAKEQSKITYALSELGRDHLPKVSGIAIKKLLKGYGLSSRYYKGPRIGLSSAVLIHQRVTEILVCSTYENTVLLATTIAAQNIDNWSKKDREKPYENKKSGMLPPKLARIMVNLALGKKALHQSENHGNTTVLDPFCGTGTALIEAGLSGCAVLGSDISDEAVMGSKQNIAWVKAQFHKEFDSDIKKSEVSALALPHNSIDYIVTEPFLGKPKPHPDQLSNIFKGLEKLYLGAFKHWQTFLKEDSVIIIVLPYVSTITKNEEKILFSLQKMIDKIGHLGYTLTSEPVSYYRPGAVIKRHIYSFTYKKN